MSIMILAVSILVAVLGVILAVWTIAATRKKHYEEYLKRGRNE